MEFLVFSDLFTNEWQATLDTTPVKIYRTDGCLRGLFVPKGKHEIVFEYKNKVWFYSLIVSLASWFFAIVILFVFHSKRKKGEG